MADITQGTYRTGQRVGRFHIYRWQDMEWWRVGDTPHFDQWFVCIVDANGEQVGDGEYVSTNPAHDPQQMRSWFPAQEVAA